MTDTFYTLNPLIIAIACVVMTFFISYLAIPGIIAVSQKKRLFDQPDHRKIHTRVTPNLGGVAIFATVLLSTIFLDVRKYFPEYNILLTAMILLFRIGLKDDLVEISPKKKFFFEFLSAAIIVLIGGIRVESMHGLLGIYELPYIISVLFSIIGITFVTNAYNLIDGVDGLAGGLGLISGLFLGSYFMITHEIGMGVFAFCIVGALLGFLRYNVSPAKIFMGDNGALVLGFSITALCILFSERPVAAHGNFLADLNPNGKLAIVIAIISVPVFDTFRVFALRILDKKSPFAPDRRHLHHALLDLGMKSTNVSMTLHSLTISFICVAILMQNMNPTITISVMGVLCICFTYVVTRLKERRLLENNAAITMIPINTVTLLDANVLREEEAPMINN